MKNIIKLLSDELFEDIQFSIKSENIKNSSKINFFKKNYLNAHPNSRSLKFNNALTELKIKINEKKKK